MKVAHRRQVLAVFTPEREGGFMVSFPDYPGCVSYGQTLIEAKRMGREVLELWLEELKTDHKSITSEPAALTRELSIHFPV